MSYPHGTPLRMSIKGVTLDVVAADVTMDLVPPPRTPPSADAVQFHADKSQYVYFPKESMRLAKPDLKISICCLNTYPYGYIPLQYLQPVGPSSSEVTGVICKECLVPMERVAMAWKCPQCWAVVM